MNDEVIFEFVRSGNFCKVSAINVVKNIEAMVVCPHNCDQFYMKKLALKALNHKINNLK